MSAMTGGPAATTTFVYVSETRDAAIAGFALDESSGKLTPLGQTAAGKSVRPLTVGPAGRFLYAALESQPSRIITYAIDPTSGALKKLAAAPLKAPVVDVSTDPSGRWLFTASYAGGWIAQSRIGADGRATAAPYAVVPVGPNPHALRADRSGRFVYVTSLGSDRIFMYRIAGGTLTPNSPPFAAAPPGSGPRHMAFSADGANLYVLGERTGEVEQFSVDLRTGALKAVGATATVAADAGLAPGAPAGTREIHAEPMVPRIWAADIAVAPNGRFVYTTERRTSTIALLDVAPRGGGLRFVTSYATEPQPRSIAVDPSGSFLVAAGERSDRIAIYRIGRGDGRLTLLGRYPIGRDASWVQFANPS